jgi:predicted small lipoprotein YifL
MNILKTSSLIVLSMGLIMALSACEQKGPAEKAGEKIDNAAETLGDKIEDATDSASDKVEEAGDKIEDATD